MDKTFDPLFQFDENSEVGDVRYLSSDGSPWRVLGVQFLPGILFDLFESQRKLFMLDIDVEYHRLDFLSFLEYLGRILHPLFPGNVRHVDQTIDPLFHSYKDTKIRNVANDPLDDASLRILLFQGLPGVRRGLFQA